MPKLFLYKDFPRCESKPEVLNCGSVSSLKEKCRDFFNKNTSYSNMLCIVSDEDNWEVLYPVISSGNGKKEHPRDSRGKGKGLGWTWDSDADNSKNHQEFTSKLQKAQKFSFVSAWNTETEESTAIAESAHNTNDQLALEEIKGIIQKNFELFRNEYRKRFGQDFERSEDVGMFYRNLSDIEAVLLWNKEAKSKNMLIDTCAFNEMILGNEENPDIVILGKNPGASGIDLPKSKSFFEDIFNQLDLRKNAQKHGIFYPLLSKTIMEALPWFSNRLIYGSTADTKTPAGILSKFVSGQNIKQQCSEKFAQKIVSLELVPYHTLRFKDGNKLISKFSAVEKVKKIVEKAIQRKAVILCPYFGALNMWLKNVKSLENYEFFYTTHFRYGQTKPAQDGNMNIEALRHYSKIGSPRTADENCDALFERLIELGWEKI